MGSIKLGFGIGFFLIALMNGWVSHAASLIFDGEQREMERQLLNKIDIPEVYLTMADKEIESAFRVDRTGRRILVGKCGAYLDRADLTQFKDEEFVSNVSRVCSIVKSI